MSFIQKEDYFTINLINSNNLTELFIIIKSELLSLR